MQSTPAASTMHVPISKCDIWCYQRNFFSQEGVNAWNGQVPFYVTSNPYIANAYAQIILRFMQDCQDIQQCRPFAPFYILELGAGSGAFGFYLVKRLLELQALLPKMAMSFVYVMTDFTLKNIEFWQQHPALQIYREQGVLDFALYDVETDQEITLLDSGVVLTETAVEKNKQNPLIVLANYVFDTISQDVFRSIDGKLCEGVITQTATLGAGEDCSYIEFKNLDESFAFEDISLPYYHDEAFDAVLLHYKNTLQETCFSFPIGSLRALKNLTTIANQQLLVMASDKGFIRQLEMERQVDLGLTLHGSFSMSVNFDAIGRYFRECGGDYLHQMMHQGIATSLFIMGQRFGHLPETRQAAMSYLNDLGHNYIYKLSRHLRDTKFDSNLETLLAGLSATQWDPRVFDSCLDVLLTKVKSATVALLYDFTQGMAKIAANFYYVPGTINTLANIALFFQEIRNYAAALHYYQESLRYFDINVEVLYNMGLCCYAMNNYADAKLLFKTVIELEPEHITAKGWMVQIESKMTASVL